MPMFNTYLMVDWSAAASPANWPPGADSIWWAAVQDRREVLEKGKRKERIPPSETIVAHERTRSSAIAHITDFLQKEVQKKRRVLVGFDFAFGYPCGFAERILDEETTEKHPALGVWEWLAARIRDDKDNANNRFCVAAELNEAIRQRCKVKEREVEGPFWGRPRGQDPGVPTKNPYAKKRVKWVLPFRERRVTEGFTKGQKLGDTVWHLFSGSSVVGSQSLVGLPHLETLRQTPMLRAHTEVWPMETGFKMPSAEHGEPRIVIVEIYPSLLGKTVEQYKVDREIRDRAQVRLNALAFSLLGEQSECIGKLFLGPEGERFKKNEEFKKKLKDIFGKEETPADACERIKAEEGWIFGYGYKEELSSVLKGHFQAQARRHQAESGA